MKDALVFDTTDVDTIAESDHVGAHTLAGDGSLITSGDGSADDVANTFEGLDMRSFLFGYDSSGDNWDRLQATGGALDVNIASSEIDITVDLDGVYDGVTNTNPDNVGVIHHTRAASLTDVQQIERTTAGALATVASASLSNISAQDVNAFAYAIDGTTGDAELLTTDGTSGGLNVHVVNSVDVNDAALANTSIANAVNTLAAANTAEDVVASPLADRKYLYIYNNDNRRMYVGASGVSSADGFPLSPRSYLELRAGAAIDIEWVSPKVGHDMRTLELS